MNLKHKKLVVALSGGKDSVALLHYYRHYSIRAIHINHHISPYAGQWQQLCQQLCRNLDIPLHIISLHFAKHNNLEHRARTARYQALFSHLAKDEILLTAHHQNDQAETVLLNLMRGSSSLGLSAMPEQKGVHYRPFLHKNRTWIEHYITENNLLFIEDESNENQYFRRNFMRHSVLPLLETVYPQAVSMLAKIAQKQQQSLRLQDELAQLDIDNYQLIKDNLLDITKLKQLAQHRVLNVLYYYLRLHNFPLPRTKIAEQIYDALYCNNDAKVHIRWAGVHCRFFRGYIYFFTAESEDYCPFYEELHLQRGFAIGYRKGGERIVFPHKTHSQALKKVLQEHNIPPWQRDKLRMYYINNTLVAIEKLGYCSLK